MKTKLRQLCAEYPLSPKWSLPEIFAESSTLLGQESEAIGLTVESATGPTAFSSAAGVRGPCVLSRAYFELIERTSILEAWESSRQSYRLIRCGDQAPGFLTRSQVFPDGDKDAPWAYSRSNGVAIHSDLNQAKRAALLEILERDAVLRSWYSNRSPTPVTASEVGVQDLDPCHGVEIRVVRFPQEIPVLGVFGFPKTENLPVFFGFAAGSDLKDTFQHAWNEALQRLIFTSEGPFPNALPDCQATPDYHLDYYLHPPSSGLIQEWLDRPASSSVAGQTDLCSKQVQYVDLTPPHLEGRLWVLKGISDIHAPLAFGKWTPSFGERNNLPFVPHPIA